MLMLASKKSFDSMRIDKKTKEEYAKNNTNNNGNQYGNNSADSDFV